MTWRGTISGLGGVVLIAACTSAPNAGVSGRAPVEGGALDYVVSGPADGEAVLTIHGGFIGMSAFEAVAVAPALADYRVIRYDRRGYNDSAPYVGPGSLAQQAADAAAVLDDLGIERAHVVAHSSGGPTAAQLAIDYPHLVHSITLLEAGRMPSPPLDPRPEPPSEPPAHVRHGMAGDYDAAAAAFMDQLFGADWRADPTLASVLEEVSANVPMFFRSEISIYAPAAATDLFERVEQPVAAALGEVTIDGFGPDFEPGAYMPGTEHLVIPGAEHSMLWIAPEATAEVIADFIGRHPM